MKNATDCFNSFVRDTERCNVGITDLEGRFVRCNHGFELLLGQTEADLEGKLLSDFFRFTGATGPESANLSEWLRQEENRNVECQGLPGTAEAFPARIYLSVLGDSENGKCGYGIVLENITPKLRLETAVRKSEELFKTAFAAIPDALVITRVIDKVVIEANGGWEQIFEYSREEVIGTSYLTMGIVDPIEGEKAAALLLSEGRIRDYEMRIRTKSGQEKITQLSVEKISIDGAECLLTILRDITAHRAAEQEIRNRQKLYRTLAGNFPGSFVILHDKDLNILVAEGSALGLLKLSTENVEAGNMRDYAPPGCFPKLEGYCRAALQGEATFHEIELNGFYLAVDNVPVSDESGEVWAGLMVARDVTEFKWIILSLEKSERSHRSLLDAIPDSIFRFDSRGVCVEFKSGQAMHAETWALEKPIGAPLREIFPREIGDLLLKNHENAHRTGVTQISEFSMTARNETHEIEARTLPLENGNTLILLRDITGSRNLERLAANISTWEQRRLGGELHDGICQELTGISFLCKRLEAKLIERAPDLGPQMAEISGLIKDGIRHTRALISGLYPAKLEHGLAEALRDLVEKLSRVYPSRFFFTGMNLDLSEEVAANLYKIAQEAASNSARHGKAGSVRIFLECQEDNLILTVTDDGEGLPESISAGSEGRGMDIMRYRARLIGARLEVQSSLGRGVILICTLPLTLAYGFKTI